MTHNPTRPRSLRQDDAELWFSTPTSGVQQQDQVRVHESSAYRTTSNQLSASSTGSCSSLRHSLPSTFTPYNIDKPLPPPPSESEKKQRTAATLRGFFRRQLSHSQDLSHLKPEAHPQHQRNSFAEATLSVDAYDHHHHHVRSMSSSPFEHDRRVAPPDAPLTHSAVATLPNSDYYQPYSLQPEYRPSHTASQQRSISVHTYFDAPPRARTFPETINSSPITRGRSRPHTWLSPTDPFTDASQFHLFAEATTGIPDNSGTFSSNSPPRLQGSLFARTNSDVPTSLRSSSASRTEQSHDITDWQNFEIPTFIPRSTPASNPSLHRPELFHSQSTQHMNVVNRELEMLGLDDDDTLPNDELPDYAQSQAEHNAGKRIEALARARELEARWQGSRAGTG
ncbi:hypothetical protein P153DRAFT_386029 [Dothidotthia symphoricarpi CBS 119687]|uniref:Uncharacterized protein n=1 Tax=Dothidotthia symphoricarpi CBS 119687 TaxID=1392245 RepID=A0A6A6AB68_9PLEO|nr:uncharacterized protein P153DRAFT_386029 [Dothidotthia symphoricarpi CBS 119687]KAF2128826.1 hypothetical protein P153DRAFT_386029 [Dothidotthia symphoricarpi CBS 119687]